MNLVELELRLRWILWAGAIALACVVLASRFAPEALRTRLGSLRTAWEERASKALQSHFHASVWILALAFSAIGAFQKFLQWYSLTLNAQDFWLFEDMLRSLVKGVPFLTHFAPQTTGLMQHGAVHPFWSLYGFLPLTWLFGSTLTALLLAPLALAFAAVVLANLAKPLWGPLGAWIVAFCFLSSTQVGRILGYDVHPEVVYPFSVLLTCWGLGVADGKLRHWAWMAGILLGFGTKVDAPFILFPVLLWFAASVWQKRAKTQLFSSVAAILLGSAISTVLFLSIRRFSTGEWGVQEFSGMAVQLPSAMPYLRAVDLDITSVLRKIAFFLVSRPWLSLLIFAPWVSLKARFWFWVLPIAAVLATLGGQPATLVNYYSASLLGGFWLAVALMPGKRSWLLFSVLALGSGAPFFTVPSSAAQDLRSHTQALLKCLPSSNAKGIVSPALIGVLRTPFGETGFEETILSEKFPPPTHSMWKSINYLLLTPTISRWEMNPEQVRGMIEKMTSEPSVNGPSWQEVSENCTRSAIAVDRLSGKDVVLLVKN
ncbi:MAG: hypothetical protein A2070_04280 [Bdellovibrionales bacterium GWC1_52_8]|nr:MAG: hypothetical protein A2Z97_09975 [Bdellovibrionales bacterium GWB1_52_6]OFZ05250.1 MAG: hypothetical protein A2X97_10690 [Bdellovibrionales bacterium GWA1_52_35]OFZ41513.1 MAG: hypothetical protein A2070_04280 [Bdellovibrionales bacterium GWC1_52_8]